MTRLKSSATFADMLATLLEGGLTLTDSLRALSGDGFPAPLRRGAHFALKSMRGGKPFALALGELSARRDLPFVLTGAQLSLVDAASRTGRGAYALREIARDIGARVEADSAFASALAYPLVVVAFALTMAIILRLRVLPLLALSGLSAPDGGAASRGIAYATAFLIASGIVSYLVVRRVFLRDSPERSVFRALAFLTGNGVPLSEALDRCQFCADDARTRSAVRMVARRVADGVSVSRAFAETDRFGALARAWLGVADENGDPSSAFVPLAAHFSARDDRARNFASRMIEPILMGITGAYVMILVETVILPVLTAAGGVHA